MVKGILFDMDGVLIDSEPATARSVVAYFASKGVNIPTTDFRDFIGGGERLYYNSIAKHYRIKDFDYDTCREDLYDAYRKEIAEEGPMAGVQRFLHNCKKAGIKTVSASSAFMEKIDINLRQCGLTTSDFTALVCGDMFKRNKPAPDIYQVAAKQIGLNPNECMVMEDSMNGLSSGHAAGCLTCGLMTSFDKQQLKEFGADYVVQTLDAFPDFDSIDAFNALYPRFA